jgi:hypothetical protein
MSDTGRSPLHVLALFGLLTFAIAADRCPPVIRKGVLHTTTVNIIGDPELAVGGNAAYVAWIESPALYVSKAGNISSPAFGTPVRADAAAGDHLSMHATSSHVYLAWRDPTNRSIRFAVSTNAGVSFAAKALATATSPAMMMHPHVVSSGTNVVVAWLEYFSSTIATLNIVKSTDSGAQFTAPQSLSTAASPKNPALVSYAGSVYLAWCDGTTLKLVRSTDAGLTFGQPVSLTGAQSGCADPQVRAVSTDVHVAWSDWTSSLAPSEVYASSSTDGGVKFSQPINISQTGSAKSDTPSLSAVGQKVYVAWRDKGADQAGDEDILFAWSGNRGTSYSQGISLSPSDFDKPSNGPVVRGSGTNVHVVWQDFGMDNADIFYRLSTKEGQAFGLRATLSPEEDAKERLGEGLPRMHAYGTARPNRLVVWVRSDPVKKKHEIRYDSWFRKE